MVDERETNYQKLREEIKELRKTVKVLTETVNDLRSILKEKDQPTTAGTYQMFSGGNIVDGDISWERLLSIVEKKETGRTATELAKEWGKSRSRTSEVLNQLVEEGRLVKVRDGRQIRFRAVDE